MTSSSSTSRPTLSWIRCGPLGLINFSRTLLGILAEVHLKSDQPQGLRVIDEALVIALRTGERFYEAELRRLKGELQLAENAHSACDAEQGVLQALEIARSQGAQLLVLRTAISLGRLWCRLGRRSEAQKLVADARRDISGILLSRDLADVNALLSGES